MGNACTEFDGSSIGRTVLVAEDEVLTRMFVADYLRDRGFRVFEAANGEEAVKILDAGGIAINLVFSDVDMPGSINGFDLARWARDNEPETKVILTSGNIDAQREAVAVRERRPLLEKPYSCSELLMRIQSLLAVETAPAMG